jgi:hypothetical protein
MLLYKAALTGPIPRKMRLAHLRKAFANMG